MTGFFLFTIINFMESKGNFLKEAFLKQIRPLDFLILALVIGAGVFCFFKTSSLLSGDTVQVKTGQATYKFSLNQNGDYTVSGELGDTVIHIENGKVKITDSPCQNKTCINQGYGTTLICLPNHVIVTVVQKESEFDAVVQ